VGDALVPVALALIEEVAVGDAFVWLALALIEELAVGDALALVALALIEEVAVGDDAFVWLALALIEELAVGDALVPVALALIEEVAVGDALVWLALALIEELAVGDALVPVALALIEEIAVGDAFVRKRFLGRTDAFPQSRADGLRPRRLLFLVQTMSMLDVNLVRDRARERASVWRSYANATWAARKPFPKVAPTVYGFAVFRVACVVVRLMWLIECQVRAAHGDARKIYLDIVSSWVPLQETGSTPRSEHSRKCSLYF